MEKNYTDQKLFMQKIISKKKYTYPKTKCFLKIDIYREIIFRPNLLGESDFNLINPDQFLNTLNLPPSCQTGSGFNQIQI